MKKMIILCCAALCIFMSSCWHDNQHISIRYKDNHDSYSMKARFDRSKTRKAERYMNEMLGRQNNISFLNTRTNGMFTLDDGSKIYIKKSPGYIRINMNRDETSDRAFHVVKDMCQGMKDVILK